ncbi:MAG: hypothetical protein ACRESZ_11915 [Methylococcales bacterium]
MNNGAAVARNDLDRFNRLLTTFASFSRNMSQANALIAPNQADKDRA